MNRYDFLTHLHRTLKPKVYLEVGVQYGASLDLAKEAQVAIGIDPHPLSSPKGNQVLFSMTSDYYFEYINHPMVPVDLAFIDGMHLYEYALRDFINIERISVHNSVIIFDDILPYNQAIAAREQPPGDWTGDVWKVYYLLKQHRPDLDLTLVNLSPTGALMVTNLDPFNTAFGAYPTSWDAGDIVPSEILTRERAVDATAAIEYIASEFKRERFQE